MIATFEGGHTIVTAYETALYGADDLVVVRGALGQKALTELEFAVGTEDEEARLQAFKHTLYNELPHLEAAEALITDWASKGELPEGLKVYPSLEGPVGKRRSTTYAHIDSATTAYPIMFGPFAISIGAFGERLFKGLRMPAPLSQAEIFNSLIPPTPIEQFTAEHVTPIQDTNDQKWGAYFRVDSPASEVVQCPGDIVLIPGTPWPSLHAVESTYGREAASLISSYVVTNELDLEPTQLRQFIAERLSMIRLLFQNRTQP